MGKAKQLLEFQGKPLLRHAAEVALASGCDPVVVVLGSRADSLRASLDGLPVHVALNERWSEGMGTSIQCGLTYLANAASGAAVDGVILGLADQPYVTAAFLRQLPELHRATGKLIVAARYSDTFGVPVFFAAQAFPWLLDLAPGEGCKKLIANHPDDRLLADCPAAATDIDTPADYARLVHP